MKSETQVEAAKELAEEAAENLEENERHMDSVAPILIKEALEWVLGDSDRELLAELHEDVENAEEIDDAETMMKKAMEGE